MRRRIKDIKLIDLFESAEPDVPVNSSEDELRDQINDLAVRLFRADEEDEFDGDFNLAAIEAAKRLGPEYAALEAADTIESGANATAYIDAQPKPMSIRDPRHGMHKDWAARTAKEEAQLAATRALYESADETESLSRGSLYRRRYYGRY